MRALLPSTVRPFHRAVLQWYRAEGRPLPWRRTRNPYRILVSEVMLQQTQVSRVIPKYREFLNTFPTLSSLAHSTPGQVLSVWQGLGYNRRALWLRQAARRIKSEYSGRFPRHLQDLTTLPGIGLYTARAIMTFAFDRQEPVIDTNISRVLSRLFQPPPGGATFVEFARSVLPNRNAYDWNQALMDLGALHCTARRPSCSVCPLTRLCPSSGRVRAITVKNSPPEPSRYGIPRRIYRGRVVKALSERSPIGPAQLASLVGLRTSASDIRWLERVLMKLVDEGLLRIQRRGGAWKAARVS